MMAKPTKFIKNSAIFLWVIALILLMVLLINFGLRSTDQYNFIQAQSSNPPEGNDTSPFKKLQIPNKDYFDQSSQKTSNNKTAGSGGGHSSPKSPSVIPAPKQTKAEIGGLKVVQPTNNIVDMARSMVLVNGSLGQFVKKSALPDGREVYYVISPTPPNFLEKQNPRFFIEPGPFPPSGFFLDNPILKNKFLAQISATFCRYLPILPSSFCQGGGAFVPLPPPGGLPPGGSDPTNVGFGGSIQLGVTWGGPVPTLQLPAVRTIPTPEGTRQAAIIPKDSVLTPQPNNPKETKIMSVTPTARVKDDNNQVKRYPYPLTVSIVVVSPGTIQKKTADPIQPILNYRLGPDPAAVAWGPLDKSKKVYFIGPSQLKREEPYIPILDLGKITVTIPCLGYGAKIKLPAIEFEDSPNGYYYTKPFSNLSPGTKMMQDGKEVAVFWGNSRVNGKERGVWIPVTAFPGYIEFVDRLRREGRVDFRRGLIKPPSKS